MAQMVEVAWHSLCKDGEELCGDWVKINSIARDLSVVLSDGLGSGVKANILATLTAEIASTMLRGGANIDEVIETLVDTLPECQVRRLAYATFAFLWVYRDNYAYLVEYDSPPMIMVRKGELVELPITERVVSGRTIREAKFKLEKGDYMVMLSDGYLHAGVGGVYRFGWGWKNIAISVKRWAATGGDAHQLTQSLSKTCLKLYNGKPGDDATAIGMWVRDFRRATILTGPPSKREFDECAVSKLMAATGAKAICGGTTAQMAARVLDQKLEIEWRPPSKQRGSPKAAKLPPPAKLAGVDLVTEGVLTLSTAVELLKSVETVHELPRKQDAATRLAHILLDADQIHFIVGDAINPHQLADLVRGKPMRQIYLAELIGELKRFNKFVSYEHL